MAKITFFRTLSFAMACCMLTLTDALYAQPDPIPEAPTNFTASPVGSVIELSWTDNSDNEAEFVIQKEWEDEFSHSEQINVPADTEAYADEDVQPNIEYRYFLWAQNEAGASQEVSAVAMITVDAPPAPANVSATAGPYMSIEIMFTDNSDLETWYEIQHSDDPNATDFYGKEMVSGGALNSVITHYISDPPFNLSIPTPPDQVFYFANTTVYIKIRGVINDNGTLIYGPFSPVISATTNPVPPKPTDFVAVIEGNNVHLSWTDNSSNEAAFFLGKFVGEFSPNTITLFTLAEGTTEFTDTDVEPNVEYSYWLMAVDLFEYTAWPQQFWPELFTDTSRVAKTLATVPAGDVPAAPVAKPATLVTPKSFTANWTTVADAEYYELDVYNFKDDAYLPGYEAKIVYDTTENVTAQKGSGRYIYVVRAVNEYGVSANSDTVTVEKTKKNSVARLGTAELSATTFAVNLYPNPVDDKFSITITSMDDETAHLEMIDIHGRLMFAQQIPTNIEVDIDASAYTAGMYLVKARQGDKCSLVRVIRR